MIRAGLRLSLFVALALTALPPVARGALDAPADKAWDGSQPPEGVFFNWYEPSFYAGFAPRTQDPGKPHIELSRGNQVRITVPLGDKELDNYLGDLVARHKVYQELVDQKVITLTVNKEYEHFLEGLQAQGVEQALASRESLGPEAYRAKAVDILSTLNPERVIRIKIPLDRVAADWQKALASAELGSDAGKLDAANAALPGRLNLYDLEDDTEAALSKAAQLAKTGDSAAFRAATKDFIERASEGHYRVPNGAVEAVEFTTIYPAGTIEATTSYKGETLPEFGVTGIWPLIRRTTGRGQTGMADYISPNPGYGFISMLPYQYAGGITYNAFHNAGVRCQLNSTPFLPSQWRKQANERDPSKYAQNLWIASRAPTSHGCTRLGSGHMSEMRQMLPTASEDLVKIPTFRNQPYCYDVFDLKGDGNPKVMGVQYYLAFRSTDDHVPIATYVTNKREPYYKWLYGQNVNLGPIGQTSLKEVPICRFAGRKAVEAETLKDVPLFEATWTPETIQFYTIRGVAPDSGPGFEFNRELRKVGAGHTTDRSALRLK
jgi:hypothetical protein